MDLWIVMAGVKLEFVSGYTAYRQNWVVSRLWDDGLVQSLVLAALRTQTDLFSGLCCCADKCPCSDISFS